LTIILRTHAKLQLLSPYVIVKEQRSD